MSRAEARLERVEQRVVGQESRELAVYSPLEGFGEEG